LGWGGVWGLVVVMRQGVRRDAFWFGEDGGRVVVATLPELVETLIQAAEKAGLAALPLGQTLPERGYAEVEGQILDLRFLRGLWERTLPYLMEA
jgi:hypothetical protein